MNKDVFKGDWKMLKGKIKEEWGKLTDDELEILHEILDIKRRDDPVWGIIS